MKTRIALAALAISTLAVLPAAAQPGPNGGGGLGSGSGPSSGPGRGWGRDMMMGPGMMGARNMGFMCNPRAAGMAEWRMDRIEKAISPNADQKQKLDALRQASTKAAETLNAACTTEVPPSSAERMALMEKRAEAALQAVRTVRPAFEALYAALDDTQKAALDNSGPRRWGWRNWHWRW